MDDAEEGTRRGRGLRRPGRVVSVVLTVLGVLFALLAGLGLLVHHMTLSRPLLLGVVAVAPYLMACSVVSLVLFGFARQWIGAAVAVVLLVAGIVVVAPLYVSSDPPRGGRDLVVMTSNLRLGQGDADDVVSEVRRHHVEALMVQELTPELQARLSAAGLDRLLPHRLTDPQGGGFGTGLWSRYPLEHEHSPRTFSFAYVWARVRVPGVSRPVTLAALHMSGPVPQSGAWSADMARLPGALRDLGSAAPGPVVVGGDFNATYDTTQFRAALTDGYQDGAEQAGAGYTRTWPANRWYPPVIAIDHVLTRGAVATSADTLAIARTDHRALLVTTRLPG